VKRFERLSDRKVANAKPGLHCDGLGLYLQVTIGADGRRNRSWLFRYVTPEIVVSERGRQRQRTRDMGLGAYPDVGLAEARERAATARRLRRDGLDPIEARRAERAKQSAAAATTMTFDQCRDAYIAAHRAGWRNPKHAAQWTSTLATYVTRLFGALPVGAVDDGLVIRALEPIWGTKPETASRVRGRVEAILDWARVRGLRKDKDGRDLLNPARWRGHLDKLLPARSKVAKVAHLAALPYQEVGAFIAALRQQNGTAAAALEFIIVTAARTGEALGAKWSEIDLVARTWTVPAERMKGGREHRVPLSDASLQVLERMLAVRTGEHVFAGERRASLSNMAPSMLLRRMKREDLTVHGFRSTFRDWAAERTGFPREVAEVALAHALKDKTEAAYQRGDLFEKRRRLMDAWAKYCAEPQAAAEVIPIGSAAQS
jgi:integrase